MTTLFSPLRLPLRAATLTAIGLAAVITLNGCALNRSEPTRPDLPVPAAWSEAPSGSVALREDWWADFNSRELNELIAIGVFVTVLPVVVYAALDLAPPLRIAAALIFPLWALLLFGLGKRHDLSVAGWILLLIPYYLRQRRFTHATRGSRMDPRDDLIDIVATRGANPVSWTTEERPDGELVLHVYEEPSRPYRAYIERAGRPHGMATVRFP